jgi:hypothetical protein
VALHPYGITAVPVCVTTIHIQLDALLALTTIPDHEIELLINTAFKALDLAHAGHVGEGFQELHYGEERASAAMEDGEPWAPELVRRYTETTDRFKREYGAGLVSSDVGEDDR